MCTRILDVKIICTKIVETSILFLYTNSMYLSQFKTNILELLQNSSNTIVSSENLLGMNSITSKKEFIEKFNIGFGNIKFFSGNNAKYYFLSLNMVSYTKTGCQSLRENGFSDNSFHNRLIVNKAALFCINQGPYDFAVQ